MAGQPEDDGKEPSDFYSHPLWLMAPAALAGVLQVAWVLLGSLGLWSLAAVPYFVSPVLCAVWAVQVSAGVSKTIRVPAILLFAVELGLIGFAITPSLPHWD